MSRLGGPVFTAVVLSIAFAADRTSAESAAGPEPKAIAARVNGKPIFVQDVRKAAEDIVKHGQATVAAVWSDALEQLVTTELLLQAAKAGGVTVSDSEVEREIQEIQGYGQDHPLAQWVKNTPRNVVREELRRSLLIDKFLDRRIQVAITKAQIEQHYREHGEQFDRPPMVRASHILVRVQGNDRDSARKSAEKLRDRARQGEDFARLAREFSQDPYTAQKGGDLGFFPERPTPVAQAAFQLEVGQVSDVVESPYGFHVIKVTDRRPAGRAPLAEVEEQIRADLEDEQRENAEESLVEALRAKTRIEILVPEAPQTSAGTAPR